MSSLISQSQINLGDQIGAFYIIITDTTFVGALLNGTYLLPISSIDFKNLEGEIKGPLWPVQIVCPVI